MAFPVYVWLDTELGVMHASAQCPGAKVPSKYGYLRAEVVRNVDDARRLDQEFRACEACREKLGSSRTAIPKTYRYRQRRGEET